MLTKWQRQHGVVEIDKNKPRKRERPNFQWIALPKSFCGWLPYLERSELRVYLLVLRHTWGWSKREDAIPQNQFIEELGLSRSALQEAIHNLEKYQLLRITRRHRLASIYEILPTICLGPPQQA
jgi:hypothetical protein